jgi:hypothetical protein
MRRQPFQVVPLVYTPRKTAKGNEFAVFLLERKSGGYREHCLDIRVGGKSIRRISLPISKSPFREYTQRTGNKNIHEFFNCVDEYYKGR